MTQGGGRHMAQKLFVDPFAVCPIMQGRMDGDMLVVRSFE